jgi:hypothetical protein
MEAVETIVRENVPRTGIRSPSSYGRTRRARVFDPP